jgi:hypothetical protein
MGLSFTIAAGLHQRSHSRVRVPRDSWPHFTVSDSRLPQPRGPCLCIISRRNRVSFNRLLRLVGLRCRYSTPPPQGHSDELQSQIYVTTDDQSASLSWNKAPMWRLRPDLYYCHTFTGLLMWGALSDERTGLPFTIAAGSSQCSHSRVRVP